MDNLKNNICRGTVVFVKDLNKNSSGHAVKGSHPAVVVQNEKGNQHSPTLIVCYLTSQLKRLEMKTHVLLQHYDHLKLSVVQAEQLTTIDKADVLGVIDQLRPEDMARVHAALSFSLGLEA